VSVSSQLREKSRQFVRAGLQPIDALHVASAVNGGSTHFLTVDDRVLKRSDSITEIVLMSPLDFIKHFGDQL
jgi:hypothetical protein